MTELDIPRIRQLYDERRFLEAYALTGEVWDHPETVEQYDAGALVLGARLASKLGNSKIERALYRYILQQFPDEPITRVYARGCVSLQTSVFDYLKDFEDNPELETDDPRLNVYWFCQNAYLWSLVRNFDRAEELLNRAETFSYDAPWLLTFRANLAFFQDQWEHALELVEQAWTLEDRIKGVFSAAVMAQCLAKLGRLEEAVERLDQIVDACQCYQLTAAVIWYIAAAAERTDNHEQSRLLSRAHTLVERLPRLAPLADRTTREQMQIIRLDLAFIERDIEQIQNSAAALHNPYFQSIRDNLRHNPRGKVSMGAFHLVWQKHNTCLPASMATVVSSTPPLNADELAAALTYGGTVSWRALDWLKEHGFAAKPFIFTAELATHLLQQGRSFIYMTEGDDWGHAMAAIGYDEATGTLILHDPSQPRHVRMILEKIEEFFGPFSPEAVAIVPAGRAEELHSIPDTAARPLEHSIRFWKTYHQNGWSATQTILDQLRQEMPEHPMTKRLQAIYFANTGKIQGALQIQEALLKDYPNSVQCRRDLLATLKQTRNTARLLQIYEDFVERNYLPGVSQEKSYPSGIYVVDYADMLNFASSGRAKALKYLRQVLFREPVNAAAYHSLGDVIRCQGKHQESRLPFLIASLLKYEDDHYARSVCDASIQTGNLEDGFTFLQRRIERFGDSPHAVGAWLTSVSTLEEYGYPDQALDVFEQAEQKYADVPEFMLFGVNFWLRMGREEQARQLLDTLQQKNHLLYFLEAATNFYYRRGEWEQALQYAEQWNEQKPGDISACRFYSFLYAFKHGRMARKMLIEQAVQHFKNDEAFEELYAETLDELFLHEEKSALLRERVERNNRDSWAWNELCHELLTRAELADEATRAPFLAEVDEVLERCRQLGEGTFDLCCLLARQKLCTGDRQEAIAFLFEALERDPSHPFPYTRIMDEARGLPQQEQQQILRRLEDKLFCTVNFLNHAVDFAAKIAEQQGLKEAVARVKTWRRKRPNDPELALSLARLWLNYGQSRSDADNVVTLLKPLIHRFPNHVGLSLALADAYATLHREDDQILAYQQILERDPLEIHARWQLSRVFEVAGRLDQAERLLAEGCQVMPIDGRCWYSYAAFLERQNLHDKGLDILRQAVDRLPGDIQLREALISRLLSYHFTAEARKHAQELLDFYPDGAYCWYILADTLHRSPDYSDLQQIETLYRKALLLNSSLLEAAEGLAQLMVSQHRYQDAHQILDTLPSASQQEADVLLTRAWIFRREGKQEEAYQEIEDLLTRFPDYMRAWQVVTDWLEDDKNWQKTQALLAEIPPVLHSQLDFRVRRLELLQKAGMSVSELDAEWDELCQEFPENQRLQLSRFDLLAEAERWDQAELVLLEYERFAPNSSYLLARKVQLLTYRGKYDEALRIAAAIWILPGDDEVWPEHFSWDVLESAGYKKKLAHAAIDALLDGKRLRLRVFERLLKHLKLVKTKLRTSWSERFTDLSQLTASTNRLIYLKLMEHLHTVEWDPARHLAMVLDHLDDIKCYRPAIKHCLKYQEYYQTMTPVLQNATMLMKRIPAKTYAPHVKEWMKNWRNIPGIQMWAVANYLLTVASDNSFRTPATQLQEQFVISRDCLQTLAFDHTARFLGSLYCEAALRLGKHQEFAAGIERYRSLLEDEQSEYWLPRKRKHLPAILLLFNDLCSTDDPQRVKEIGHKLKQHVPGLFSWLAPLWWQHSAGKLSLSRRVWVFLTLFIR